VDELRWHGMFSEARVVGRCAFCSFVIEAPLEEAHAAFEADKCGRPKPENSARRRSGFGLEGDAPDRQLKPAAGTTPSSPSGMD
jgi:hypothetical protein